VPPETCGASGLPTITQEESPGDVGAIDFLFDSTMAGKPFKILSIVDEHTREAELEKAVLKELAEAVV